MLQNSIVLILVTFLMSCTNKGESPAVKAQYEQVMAIHDEVMVKLKPLRVLRKALEEKLKNLDYTEHAPEISERVKKVELAEEGMMVWMKNFKLPADTPEEKQLSYLKAEQNKMEALQIETDNAIKKGNDLLRKIN